MNKQKIFLAALIAALIACNAAFYLSAQDFVQQFAHSVYKSRQASEFGQSLLLKFSPEQLKFWAQTGPDEEQLSENDAPPPGGQSAVTGQKSSSGEMAAHSETAAQNLPADQKAPGGQNAVTGQKSSGEQNHKAAKAKAKFSGSVAANFSELENAALIHSELSAQAAAKLLKNGEFFSSQKLDANLFKIKFYRDEGGEFMGFSGIFELSSARLNASYAMGLISLFVLAFSLQFYRFSQKNLDAASAKVAQINKRLAREQKLALIDPITGLGNKASLNKALSCASAPKIILADVLDFRKITDYFDSTCADDLLRQLAFILSEFAGENELELFYIEGDVFVFLQDSDEDLEHYESVLASLLELIKGREFTISFGGNSFDIVLNITLGMCLEPDNALRKAQIALARAKAEYKNFVCYAKYLSDEKSYLETLSTAKNIKDAVSNNEIIPFFQPIYDRGGKICKYESLVRIVKKTPEGTVVLTPQSFLAISVKMKQYEQIEGFIINKVIQALQDNPQINLSVNLSGRDMSDSVQNARFLSKVRAAGVAERLIIEVLEDEDISQNARIKDFLRRAKEMGCKIAIDDFGSGFSNFAYLLELMPHYIKIDGSIVRNICDDEKSRNILKTIVLFSRSLGIRTVAEFVASKEIYELCYELGVDEFQGFYLGKPSPSFTPEEIDLDFYKLEQQ